MKFPGLPQLRRPNIYTKRIEPQAAAQPQGREVQHEGHRGERSDPGGSKEREVGLFYKIIFSEIYIYYFIISQFIFSEFSIFINS
jgi:hypothetical protein